MITTKLHIRMAEHRLTQSELSEQIGIRQPTISAYCNDNYIMISKEHLNMFCKFFKCSIADIIDFVDDDNNFTNNNSKIVQSKNKKEIKPSIKILSKYDTFISFLKSKCNFNAKDIDYYIETEILYSNYVNWCNELKYKYYTMQSFLIKIKKKYGNIIKQKNINDVKKNIFLGLQYKNK